MSVDCSVYSLPALLRTCYWFTDRCYILVTRGEVGCYLVHIANKTRGEVTEEIAGEFANALLDNQLRVELNRETQSVRELIVAKAFAEGDLLEDVCPGRLGDPVQTGKDWDAFLATGEAP